MQNQELLYKISVLDIKSVNKIIYTITQMRICKREEGNMKKIIGIFVCMLLIISVYTVSAANIRLQEKNVIEEIGNQGETDFILIVSVHHSCFLYS